MDRPTDEIDGRALVDQLGTAVGNMARVQQAAQEQARQLAEQRKAAPPAGGEPPAAA